MKYLKFALPLLFAIAIGLGLVQRKSLPDFSFGSNASVTHFADSGDKSLADYYQTAQQLKSDNNSTGTTTVTFLAVGDINLSRGVATTIQKSGDKNFPFLNMAETLKSTDFNFANLESPMAPDTLPCHLQPDCSKFLQGTNSRTGIIGGHSLVFAAPFSYLAGLESYNFKIVNLANNHAFDQGLEGIVNTKLGLDSLLETSTSTEGTFDVITTGTGRNLDEAWTPAILDIKGIKICFIGASYSSINDGGKAKNNYVARIEDLEHLRSSIFTAKGSCDFTVVTMHAGTEYVRQPNESQIKFAKAAIDYGGDMVIGAHPHWVQTIEKYNGKYIFYSLGNFIFDQAWSKETSEGLTLKISLNKKIDCSVPIYGQTNKADESARYNCTNLQGSKTQAQLDSVELIPVIISNSSPRPATEVKTKNILNKIGQTESILK